MYLDSLAWKSSHCLLLYMKTLPSLCFYWQATCCSLAASTPLQKSAADNLWFLRYNRYPNRQNGLETAHEDNFWRVFGEALEDLETCGQSELLREIEVNLALRSFLSLCVCLSWISAVGNRMTESNSGVNRLSEILSFPWVVKNVRAALPVSKLTLGQVDGRRQFHSLSQSCNLCPMLFPEGPWPSGVANQGAQGPAVGKVEMGKLCGIKACGSLHPTPCAIFLWRKSIMSRLYKGVKVNTLANQAHCSQVTQSRLPGTDLACMHTVPVEASSCRPEEAFYISNAWAT